VQAVLEASLAFPTVIFTVLLAFALLYAALVIVGALDLDFLDGVLGIDSLEAADGAMDAADGADHLGAAGIVAGIMAALGIAGIPITVWGSVLVLLAWMLCMIGMQLVVPLLPQGPVGTVVAAGIGFASFLVGGFVASRLVRPLRRIYVTESAPRRSSLIGHSCTILSARVDAASGRGEIDDGGSGFIAEIRCDRPNELKRGDQSVVYDYDPIETVFHVVPTASGLDDLELD
jgi:hypothetical protein